MGISFPLAMASQSTKAWCRWGWDGDSEDWGGGVERGFEFRTGCFNFPFTLFFLFPLKVIS